MTQRLRQGRGAGNGERRDPRGLYRGHGHRRGRRGYLEVVFTCLWIGEDEEAGNEREFATGSEVSLRRHFNNQLLSQSNSVLAIVTHISVDSLCLL